MRISRRLQKYLKNRDDKLFSKVENEAYKTDNKFLNAKITIVLGFTALLVTISSAASFVTIYKYDEKIQELQNNSNSTKYLIMAGRAASTSERINNYTLAINYDNKNPFLYYARADIYYEDEGLPEMALKDCNQALKYDAFYTNALFLRGKIYFEKAQYSLSVEDFKNYCAVENNTKEVNTYIGYAYYFMDDIKSAVQYFDMLEEKPTFPSNIEGDYEQEAIISDCYLKTGSYLKAKYFLNPLIEKRCSRHRIEFIANKLIEIYKTEGDLQSVSVLEKMLEEMDSQYEKIRKMTYDTVEIQGIETYQMLYHELMVRTSETLD